MSKITKVICFDVRNLSPNEIEKFKEHIDMFTFLSDVMIDSELNRISYIRAFFDVDINIEHLVKGFNVKYNDITGTDLITPWSNHTYS